MHLRVQVPNGDLTSKQLRFLGDCIKDLPGGCGDVTTRANIQLRGITLAEADQIIEGLVAHGLSSVMSGMDNVRNITGSPIAGIDPHELINVRELTHGAGWGVLEGMLRGWVACQTMWFSHARPGAVKEGCSRAARSPANKDCWMGLQMLDSNDTCMNDMCMNVRWDWRCWTAMTCAAVCCKQGCLQARQATSCRRACAGWLLPCL